MKELPNDEPVILLVGLVVASLVCLVLGLAIFLIGALL